MSEDLTRATRSDAPRHGSVGPNDPHSDPATDPGMRPVGPAYEPRTERIGEGKVREGDDPPTAPVPTQRDAPAVTRTRTGGLWTGLILSALVLIVLLVFILQNLELVQIQFLGFVGRLPTGVALLLASIAGLLLVAIPGGLRILQLRRVAKRATQL